MNIELLKEKNKTVLLKYIPENAVLLISDYIIELDIKLKIKGNRKSKWGDFQVPRTPEEPFVITVNKSLNKYAFLITLVHEIAHLTSHKAHGRQNNPHGDIWKREYQKLMNNFLIPEIFPIDILYVLRQHMKNPKASATADVTLYKVLMNYDDVSNKIILDYIKDGEQFIYENEIYKRILKRLKKIECVMVVNKRVYLFSPIAEVERAEE